MAVPMLVAIHPAYAERKAYSGIVLSVNARVGTRVLLSSQLLYRVGWAFLNWGVTSSGSMGISPSTG